ncbi:MAG: prepilin-type N-terminal cleavage/methylation domain-containing protein [Opitutae bacterium]|nr:prepilin-type N-terminal cleavage/methylation domain-containing protein [Opitutae bacterium]
MMNAKKIKKSNPGFTLIEVLVSMAVLVVLILALTRMFVEAANITKRGTTALARNSVAETALETILQDIEGMVVNERLACQFRGDTMDRQQDPATFGYGFGFDEAWFITTSGDQDDSRAYQTVHYYVTNSLTTNSLGAAYVRFQLIRQVGIFANADKWGVDIMGKEMDWWNPQKWDGGQVVYSDKNVLAENVIRFDFYLLGWKKEASGHSVISWLEADGNPTNVVFNSILGPRDDRTQTNLPPAAIDVYFEVTSPEVASESGMALVPGVEKEIQLKAREMMFRDSASLFGRASPIAGGAQKLHPAQHYTD